MEGDSWFRWWFLLIYQVSTHLFPLTGHLCQGGVPYPRISPKRKHLTGHALELGSAEKLESRPRTWDYQRSQKHSPCADRAPVQQLGIGGLIKWVFFFSYWVTFQKVNQVIFFNEHFLPPDMLSASPFGFPLNTHTHTGPKKQLPPKKKKEKTTSPQEAPSQNAGHAPKAGASWQGPKNRPPPRKRKNSTAPRTVPKTRGTPKRNTRRGRCWSTSSACLTRPR